MNNSSSKILCYQIKSLSYAYTSLDEKKRKKKIRVVAYCNLERKNNSK